METPAPESQSPMQRQYALRSRFIIFALIGIIILGVVIFAVLKHFKVEKGVDTGEVATSTEEAGVYTQINLEEAEGEDRLPEGFPSDLPINEETIINSSNALLNGGATRQADLVYTSEAPIAEIMESYEAYFETNGYTFKSTGEGSTEGVKAGTTIRVGTMPLGDSTNVIVTVLETN